MSRSPANGRRRADAPTVFELMPSVRAMPLFTGPCARSSRVSHSLRSRRRAGSTGHSVRTEHTVVIDDVLRSELDVSVAEAAGQSDE